MFNVNGGPSIAVILTLDGPPVMFWFIEKNVHVAFHVFKVICIFIFLWNKILSSLSNSWPN